MRGNSGSMGRCRRGDGAVSTQIQQAYIKSIVNRERIRRRITQGKIRELLEDQCAEYQGMEMPQLGERRRGDSANRRHRAVDVGLSERTGKTYI